MSWVPTGGRALLKEYKDHALKGNLKDFRECHVESDWLLIYTKDEFLCTLTLSRTGSHSLLLGK